MMSSLPRPGNRGQTSFDDEEIPDRQCVLYYTNTNARYAAADTDMAQHNALPQFQDPEDYYEEDDNFAILDPLKSLFLVLGHIFQKYTLSLYIMVSRSW